MLRLSFVAVTIPNVGWTKLIPLTKLIPFMYNNNNNNHHIFFCLDLDIDRWLSVLLFNLLAISFIFINSKFYLIETDYKIQESLAQQDYPA